MTNEYVTVEFRIHRVAKMPEPSELTEQLASWGLQLNAQEAFWVVAYDGSRNLRTVVEVARGSYNDVVVAVHVIVEAVD